MNVATVRIIFLRPGSFRWLSVFLWSWLLMLNSAGAQKIRHPDSPVANVLVFLSTECPISQQYCRRLRELHQEFARQGVSFHAYFPLSTDDYRAIGRFRRDYPLPFPAQTDRQQQMARRFKARITPEVVVQDRSGLVVYQGAIDDWFVSLGKHRPEPTQHFLRDALQHVLHGEPVTPARTEAVGCYIE